MNFDQNKLDSLLKEGRLAEAKDYIREVLTSADPNAKADAAIDYALAYIKTANSINADYLKSLKETAELLKKAKMTEGRSEDKVKLAKVKTDLNIK